MAQKRLIDKKISLSEKLAELPFGAQLLYTWMIPHADDFGLLQGSPRTIKAQVLPMADVSLADVTSWIIKMERLGLLKSFKYQEKEFYHIQDFEKNQNLRHDMQPYIILPIELGKDYQENWKKCEKLLSKCLSVTGSDEIVTEDTIQYSKEDTEDKEVIPPVAVAPGNKKKKKDKYEDDPIVEYCREKQGIEKRFVNYGKQLDALRKMRLTEYSEDDIKFVIDEMAAEPFWKGNPFDMMTVANQMHKYMNRTVMFDQKKKGGEKYSKL